MTTKHPDELTLAYLAGCMDSDGFFTITRTEWSMRNRGRGGDCLNPTFNEKIGLRQVTPEVPKMLYDLFGGNLYVATYNSKAHPNRRPLHAWDVQCRKAGAAVELLLPYLRVKREQALLILEFRRHKEQKRVGRTTSPEAVAIRDDLTRRIQALNAVGVKAAS